MITENGKQILRKYLVGMTPALATHISIGCGALPLTNVSPPYDPTNGSRTNMKFEMVRVPITSRGIVYEDGVHKLALQAELPIQDRFQITEVGLWSGARNLRAAQFDSKVLATFNAAGESWFLSTASVATSALPTHPSGICAQPSGNIVVSDKVFGVTNDADAWVNFTNRKNRYECPRFYNNSIMNRGDYTNLTYADGVWTEGGTAHNAIETSSIGVNMSKNPGVDEIRLAFSVVPVDNAVPTLPDHVNIWLEFVNNFGSGVRKFAIAKASLDTSMFDSNYHVHTFLLSDFVADSGFSWSSVNGIRLRTSLQLSNAVTSNWYFLCDGLRLENVSNENPTYGLVAYEQVATSDALPALKTESTNNYIEFRLEVNTT